MAVRKSFALVIALLVALWPSSAFAHDALVGSDPADGASLETAPEVITLSFSGEPIDIAPQIILRQNNETVAELSPELDGFDVHADVPDLAGGEYQIAYSIVSSDGHRIEGFTTFTLADGSEQDASASEPASDQPEPTSDAGSGEPAEDQSPTQAENSEDNGAVTWIRLGGIIVVILGLGVIVRRKLRERG